MDDAKRELVHAWLIQARVKQGGHPVKREDAARRFERGWRNFATVYRPLADVWAVYDNSGESPRLLQRGA
jgi:predicted ABC-type ATPase